MKAEEIRLGTVIRSALEIYGAQVWGAVQISVGLLTNVIGSGLSTAGLAIVQWAAAVIVSPFTSLVSAVLYFLLLRSHDEEDAVRRAR